MMSISTMNKQAIGLKPLANSEPSNITNFPDTFQDFFSKISEDEDSDDLIVAMLEDKLIPRNAELERKRLEGRRGGVYRRSFSRKISEYNNNTRGGSECEGEGVVAVSPSTVRRRASSIAVTRQPPDLHRFLQAEQQRPWGHISPRSASPCGGSAPWQRPVSPRALPRHPPVLMAADKPGYRSRTASMPAVPRHRPMLGQIRKSDNSDVEPEYYRVRSFSITPNGIFNLGDSFRSRRSRSINSVSSTGSSGGVSGASISNRDRVPSTSSHCSIMPWDSEEPGAVPKFKVAMLGSSGVGKTALTCQFTTSEYICAYDTSLDEEFGQKTVSVMLDGQEADLEIVDHPACEMSAESFCSTYNPDVFVVVYSVVDRKSLKAAEDILMFLWKEDYVTSRGVILVGNKADLERKREVPMAAGRKLANSCGCKFIETSSGLDHNVDELLVGILAQVQLNPRRNREKICKKKKKKQKVRIGSGQRMLRQLLGIKRKSRSCENLLIL